MGTFKFNNNISTKTLSATLEGVFSVEEAVNFMVKFKQTVAVLKTNQYNFILDCEKVGVGTKESVEKLGECFALYKQYNFKHITFEVRTNSILKMQLSRLARTISLTNFDIK